MPPSSRYPITLLVYMVLQPSAKYYSLSNSNSVTFSPQATVQRGGSPTVVNLSFLDRSHYFSFK
jgi:hypothetical protein